MWRRPSSRTAVVGSAILLFVVCCLCPVGYLLFVSLSGTDEGWVVWLDARQRRLLSNTACLGAGTATLATAIGAPLGLALARIAIPRRALPAASLHRGTRLDIPREQPRARRNPRRTRPPVGVDLQFAGGRHGLEPCLLSVVDAGDRGGPPPRRRTSRRSRTGGRATWSSAPAHHAAARGSQCSCRRPGDLRA